MGMGVGYVGGVFSRLSPIVMRLAGDKSNASLLLAVPVIPVFLGDADRGKLGPLMLLRDESIVVGSCPVPVNKPSENVL